MVGAIVLSRTDAAIIVIIVRKPWWHAHGLHVTQPYSIVSSAPIDLDGQVGVGAGVSSEVNELVRLVVHLAGCLYAEYGGDLRHPLRA